MTIDPAVTGSATGEGSGDPRIAVLDYGSGNLRSAVRAVERAGARVELTDDVDAAAAADALVVPGVGAFAACMAGLTAVGGDRLIRDQVAAGRPLLAICVGFQVLFTEGVEHGERTAGCGVLEGRVEAMTSRRLPHMGWNTLTPGTGSRRFPDAPGPDQRERFYFVHSYGVHGTVALSARPDAAVITTTVEHDGDTVVAAVEHGSLLATQFHPEKSADAGARLLRSWVAAVGAVDLAQR